ncbi:MAG: hypothetical protein ABEK59_06955 [Halobacteria archaeon]
MKVSRDTIELDKSCSELDELVVDVAGVLSDHGLSYSVVAGYVAVSLGRSRATEDIDVIVEIFDEDEAEKLVSDLLEEGYWGVAEPLEYMYDRLEEGLNVRVAEKGKPIPNVELKFPSDTYDRISLDDNIELKLDCGELRLGCLELQIPYKLYLGTRKDREDALHLYSVMNPHLDEAKLDDYASRLSVQEELDDLRDESG